MDANHKFYEVDVECLKTQNRSRKRQRTSDVSLPMKFELDADDQSMEVDDLQKQAF